LLHAGEHVCVSPHRWLNCLHPYNKQKRNSRIQDRNNQRRKTPQPDGRIAIRTVLLPGFQSSLLSSSKLCTLAVLKTVIRLLQVLVSGPAAFLRT